MVVSVNVCADAVLKTAILDTASYLGLGEIFTRLSLNLAYLINLFDTDLNYFISIILMGVALAEFGS